MTDAAAALVAPKRPSIKRNSYGQYLITDPRTGVERAFVRATTVVKTLDDEYHLTKWECRMAAKGIAERDDLYALAKATPVDDKQTFNDIVEKAQNAAQSDARANSGTAQHSFVERIERGEPLESLRAPEPYLSDLRAYVAEMAAHGVKIDSDGLERVLVCLDLEIAGTTDKLKCWRPGLRLPQIGDLKTGSYVDPLKWAIQLAIYANADTVWNPSTSTHEPMPEVDRTRALVIHLPFGEARCDLYEVDIEAGYEALQRALWVRGWRKRKDVGRLLAAPNAIDTTATETPTTVEPDSPLATPEQFTALHARVLTIKDAGHIGDLATRWPANVPTLKQSGHTVAHLETIGRLCADVEREHSLPFIVDPVATPEYVQASDPRVVAVIGRLSDLPADLIEHVQTAALANQCPRLSTGRATPDDLRIVDKLVTGAESEARERHDEVIRICEAYTDDVDIIESLLDSATGGREYARGVNLTAPEVAHLAALVKALDLAIVGLTYTDPETGAESRPTLMTTEQAERHILERYGSKRDALVAAKNVATSLGRNKPRSVAQTLEDPLLTAAVATFDFSTKGKGDEDKEPTT